MSHQNFCWCSYNILGVLVHLSSWEVVAFRWGHDETGPVEAWGPLSKGKEHSDFLSLTWEVSEKSFQVKGPFSVILTMDFSVSRVYAHLLVYPFCLWYLAMLACDCESCWSIWYTWDKVTSFVDWCRRAQSIVGGTTLSRYYLK